MSKVLLQIFCCLMSYNVRLIYKLLALAEDFLHDYIRVNVGSLDTSANHNITQIVDVVHEVEKEYKLLHLLEDIMGGSENKVGGVT